MNTEKKLDLILGAGAALLGSGANSNRVESGIMTAAAVLGVPRKHLHLHMNLRTLMLSVEEDGRCVTKFRKVIHHTVDMNRIANLHGELERLLREARAPGAEPAECAAALSEAIDTPSPRIPGWIVIPGVGAACAGSCALLGGDAGAMLFAALGASAGLFVRRFMLARHANPYFSTLVAATISAWTAAPNLHLNPGAGASLAIAGSVLYLIPGVALINALDDLIDGFTIMGVGRATTATLHLSALTFGLLISVGVLRLAGIPLTTV